MVRGTGGPYAMSVVHRAIRRGELKAAAEHQCADCGKSANRYDHRDYNAPLRVDPVCHSCNARRGPAIPLKGYFEELFSGKYMLWPRRKKDATRMLAAMGVDIDLSGAPDRLKFEHWLPFKEVLLEWDCS
ncbi:hypothetical protein QF001_000888 [Paraburkholderia youngii]|uniref:hypothetical protein n=1 Tax=Paraburkholderia youngii TaxID=2782701 RepID=UPI003D1A63E9